jgi:hypothetical protein
VARQVARKTLQVQRLLSVSLGVEPAVDQRVGLTIFLRFTGNEITSVAIIVVFFVVLDYLCGELHRVTASRKFNEE